MSIVSRDRLWGFVATASAVAAAMAVRAALKRGWRAVADEDPPQNPASKDTGWGEALLWTALSGAAAGVARMLAQRASTQGWRRATGDDPPGV